jgi:5'-nucleotidase
MTTDKPLVMISNDDGVNALGLHHLIDCTRELIPNADIVAVAPEGHNSGMSSAISVNSMLRITRKPDYNGAQLYAVSGTPVDCVKLGMHAVMHRKPDLMLSGVNHGSNAGNSLIYSGTMGAAMEACMIGIPAIGYSLLDHDPNADFSSTIPFIAKITSYVLEHGLPNGVCLNVNFPANCIPKGIKITHGAAGRWTEEYKKYIDPQGNPFYWLTGNYVQENLNDAKSDMYWLERKWASITPVHPDQSAVSEIQNLAAVLEDKL